MNWFRNHGASEKPHPEQEQDLREHLRAAPSQYKENASRWSLALIQKMIGWLKEYSLSGIWRLLQALDIHYKRGQQHMHSPDPEYLVKAAEIQGCVQAARDHPGAVVTLFLDELTFYRWAEVAPVYAAAGRIQPQVTLPCQYNTPERIVSVIDAVTGQVLYRIRSHISVAVLVDLLGAIREAYPDAVTLYVVQDNWHNVHFNPRQLAAAQQHKITLVALPTYSPWLNPVEKLWRKLSQDVLLMHRNGKDWDQLKSRVTQFLDQYTSGSNDLLRYVGLLPD